MRGARPGEVVTIDGTTPGYPELALNELPPGDYIVQALLNVYTEFHRADGHVVWAHMDQWEGQRLARSPGNFFSEPQSLRVGPDGSGIVRLSLSKVIPPVKVPADTAWVKRVKFQSKLLTAFWGRPIFVGATILLPKGYEEHPEVRYPVLYLQGHFSLKAPFEFTTEPDQPGAKSWARQREEWVAQGLDNVREPPPGVTIDGALVSVESGYEFYQAWISDQFPRMIVVSFQHPTPYYDASYAVNSATCGPYGDAMMTELIPYVENHFRIIGQPYARVLAGGSTGGWTSLALQIYHPDFFGGTWSGAPDPVDLRGFNGIDLYQATNAFAENLEGRPAGTGQTARKNSQRATIQGDRMPGYEVHLMPVDSDGCPKPVWDPATGEIDRAVVQYMRAHDYDLCEFLQRNWPRLGSKLTGKLHLICGEKDPYVVAVRLLEEFLEKTKDPYYGGSFTYGQGLKFHGWQPTTNAELIRTMAKFVADRAPEKGSTTAWQGK